MRMLWAICAVGALGGCATITRGTTDQVTVNSDPPGAHAVFSEGHTCPATPCTFEVNRKSEFIVSFSKDGYQPQQIAVGTKIEGGGAAGLAGNVIFGGLIGVGVDASNGASLDHFPNPVFATLLPIAGRPPLERARPRRRPDAEANLAPPGT